MTDKNREEHNQFIKKLHLENQKVWAKMIFDDKVDNEPSVGDIILFSLVNKAMIEVDERFYKDVLNKSDEISYYTPYIYGFMVKVDANNKEIIKKIIKENRQQMQKGYLPCKLMPLNSGFDSSAKTLRGISFFSSSPFIYKGRTLVFLNGDNEDIPEELLDCQAKETMKRIRNQSQIEANRLNEYLPSRRSKGTIKIYNVGQAECSYFTSNSYKIMFDIGVDKKWLYEDGTSENAPSVIKKNYNDICKCSPKVMFLSHWDADHIIGVSLLRDGFPNLWVAPDILERETIPMGTARLHNYLCYKKQLLTVLRECNGRRFYCSDFLSIYKGNPNREDANNNHGIIVVIGGNDYMNERIIFPGDCEYEAWPENLDITRNPYEVLIVPHHGAAMALGNPSLGSLSCEKKFAIFSYGKGNQYGHPSGEHVLKLRNIYNYEVVGVAEYQYIQITINSDAHIKSIIFPTQQGYGDSAHADILLGGISDGN